MRAPIRCGYCQARTCTVCVKRYLLGTPEDPHCLHCRAAWNREFIDANLTRSWREGELRKHRALLLFERERSLLPATQPLLEEHHRKLEWKADIIKLRSTISRLKIELEDAKRDILMKQESIRRGVQMDPEAAERRKFVAACPGGDCRGFLSTAYKCGTCATQFCAHCREKKPKEGPEHCCNPDLVATIAAIVKDSRPCPKCGTAISKVDGCDQMFCTNCDTAFSWIKGTIVAGAIHNPHYFARMRALAAAAVAEGTAPATATATALGAAPCGDVAQFPREMYITAKMSNTIGNRALNRSVSRIYQAGLHVQHVVLARPIEPYSIRANADLRVDYLLKQIDEKRFKITLQQRDRTRARILEVREPLELFVLLTMEFFHGVVRSSENIQPSEVERLKIQIRDLVNEPLVCIGQRYNASVPQIVVECISSALNHTFEQRSAYVESGWSPSK